MIRGTNTGDLHMGHESSERNGKDEPSCSVEAASAERRGQLARNWLTSVEVAKRFAIDDQDVARQMNQLRGAGAVLAVYWEMDGGSWRYPEWQFGKDGQPLPFLAEIIGVLRQSGLFLGAQGMSTGWGELEWFMTRHVLLGAFTPIEVLQTDPGSVLMAAEQEFYGV